MKDANGFVKQESPVWVALIGVALSAVTAFIYLILFYDMSFERKYWRNRWTLYRHLRRGRVVKTESRELPPLGGPIVEYDLEIGGTAYNCWIFSNEQNMTFGPADDYQDYIGLFCSSPIMWWINNRNIKMIQSLEMEKEQHQETYKQSRGAKIFITDRPPDWESWEEYYNETFNPEKP